MVTPLDVADTTLDGMIARWKNDSLLLTATPIVAGLAQILILAYVTSHQTVKQPANLLLGLLFIVALLLPVISVPTFIMSLRQVRAKRQRTFSFIACVLNGVYAVFLVVGIAAILGPVLGHATQ